MAEPLRVLLAEDEPALRVTTRLVLEKHGFAVDVAADGTEAERLHSSARFDVALLDIRMPGRDGIWLTKHIASTSGTPVVLLTARDLAMDQVMGLEAGADDYITKPFDSDVLAARLKAVIRRRGAGGAAQDDAITLGDLAIDRDGMTITTSGEPLDLTATEFRLLMALLDHQGAVLSRTQLLDLVWGDSTWTEERVVDVNVQRLRAKIGADYIQTVRGAGYKLVDA